MIDIEKLNKKLNAFSVWSETDDDTFYYIAHSYKLTFGSIGYLLKNKYFIKSIKPNGTDLIITLEKYIGENNDKL
jgi:hypothetical protein